MVAEAAVLEVEVASSSNWPLSSQAWRAPCLSPSVVEVQEESRTPRELLVETRSSTALLLMAVALAEAVQIHQELALLEELEEAGVAPQA